MHLRLSPASLPGCLCLALLLIALSASTAIAATTGGYSRGATEEQPASRHSSLHGGPLSSASSSSSDRTRSSTSGHVFPLLQWLRDSAAEVIFGPSDSSSSSSGSSIRGNLQGGKQYPGATRQRYRDEVVVRFNVTTPSEEAALAEAADRLLLDIWAFTHEYVDVRLYKDDVRTLLSLLPEELRHPEILVEDVAAAVWGTYPAGGAVSEKAMRADMLDGVDGIFFRDYQPLSVIMSWLRLLEAMFPSHCELISIGQSYEGRDIPAMRLGRRGGDDDDSEDTPRKTILVTGGIHAREWISTSTVNYLVWSFATGYGEERLITKVLQHFDVVFVPVVNPDGYEYTWSGDRLWRKSRQQTSMRYCKGLDLDHAFGYEWGDDGSNEDGGKGGGHPDPCSESYGGDKPFQAIEASALAAWAGAEVERGVHFLGLLDLHSYSQQVLFPYAYSCAVDPPNRENLEELATGLAKAIRLASGELYGVASACEGATVRNAAGVNASAPAPRVENGGGSAIDWFYHDLKAHFSFQVKLRDTGSYGFLLPPENIVPTGEEMFNAMKYFGDFLLGNNGIEKSTGKAEEGEFQELRRRSRR